MSALRDQTNLECWECGLDLNNIDPIPPTARFFVGCVECENGGIPLNNGNYEICNICKGYGELVLCRNCYHRYLYSD